MIYLDPLNIFEYIQLDGKGQSNGDRLNTVILRVLVLTAGHVALPNTSRNRQMINLDSPHLLASQVPRFSSLKWVFLLLSPISCYCHFDPLKEMYGISPVWQLKKKKKPVGTTSTRILSSVRYFLLLEKRMKTDSEGKRLKQTSMWKCITIPP